ncbi:MAG TPA: beta-propeller fold lactonase family protein [Blastocatellia bacterium]|nr:beta-propeller fold lactonase family protein [Blastocatellia bacterium]
MKQAIKSRTFGRAIFAVVLALSLLAFSLIESHGSIDSAPQYQSRETASTARSFVYTITNASDANSIAAYSRNAETGELTFIGTFPTGGRGTGAIVDSQSPIVANADGTRLYAVNTASNDISVMAIRDDGSLELIGSPVPSNGIAPASLALFDDLLYVTNKGNGSTTANYTGFRLNADELMPVRRSTVELSIGDNPGHILFNPSGDVVIGTRISGRAIDSFIVRRNSRKYGRLRPVATLRDQPGPFGAAFNPAADSQLIVSSVRLPGAASYRVFSDGAIVPVNAVGNAPERAACWVTVHPDGQFAWVANTPSNSLSLYTINRDGSLRLEATRSTAAFGRLPFEMAIDRAGRFLYVLHVGTQNILALRVSQDTSSAGLEAVGAFAIPINSTPMGLVVVEKD